MSTTWQPVTGLSFNPCSLFQIAWSPAISRTIANRNRLRQHHKWIPKVHTYIAGGIDIFADHAKQPAAKDRIVTSEAVIAAKPDIILASWCGKKVSIPKIRERSGWNDVPAVVAGRIHEIKSSIVLQPGPAALTDGLDAILAVVRADGAGKGNG